MSDLTEESEVPACTSCGSPLENFPLTMRGMKIDMRCKHCVQSKNPEAYSRGSNWLEFQENRMSAERMA